jgi:hypothetical protein
MAFPRKIRDLCAPSMLYFIISIISLIVAILMNLGHNNKLVLGSYSMSVVNTTLIFVVKLIFILLWTWILNLICKDGHEVISWILVFLPFIAMFLCILAMMVN